MFDRDHSNDPKDPAIDGPQTDKGEPSKSYKVGYRRPPMDRCFKPGRSGNPKGRPKGSRNAKTLVTQVVNKEVTIRENGKVRKVTTLEAMLLAAVQKAMKGDSRALNSVIGLLARTNQLTEAEAETSAVLPEDDAAILADFLRRHSGDAGPNGGNESENR